MKILALILALSISFGIARVGLAVEKPLFHLNTEDFPPYNFRDSQGRICGVSLDSVVKSMKRTGFKYQIEIFPWVRAYNMALSESRNCVFSTLRTDDREKLFHWIGPIASVEWVLIAKKGTPAAKIHSLNEARPFTIGGTAGGGTMAELIKNGFKVETVFSPWLNRDKLESQRIQLWFVDPLYMQYEISKGAPSLDFVKVVVYRKTNLYLACNIQTPLHEIEKIKHAFADIKKMRTKNVSEKKLFCMDN